MLLFDFYFSSNILLYTPVSSTCLRETLWRSWSGGVKTNSGQSAGSWGIRQQQMTCFSRIDLGTRVRLLNPLAGGELRFMGNQSFPGHLAGSGWSTAAPHFLTKCLDLSDLLVAPVELLWNAAWCEICVYNPLSSRFSNTNETSSSAWWVVQLQTLTRDSSLCLTWCVCFPFISSSY